MRYATVRIDGATGAARVEGDDLVVLDAVDVGALLAGRAAGREAPETGVVVPFGAADLAPVVTRPGKIVCLGLNYRAHIEEMGRELPDHPTLFAKFASALIGARDPIALPRESDQVDWEGELAFVVGRRVRRAATDEAAAAIAGFTVLNDVSMRDWQYRTLQWLQGKTFEAATPVGPVLVTPDEVGHEPDLELTVEVDDRPTQKARTSDLVFPPVSIVEYLSTIFTLEPGDLVATGTPGGVGFAATPPEFLGPGSVVRVSIEQLGVLENRCEHEH